MMLWASRQKRLSCARLSIGLFTGLSTGCSKSEPSQGREGVPDEARANAQILERVRLDHYDVLWLNKALTIYRSTLEAVKRMQPKCLIVGYFNDDVLNPGNQSPQFLEHLPMYDAFFTTKTYNVEELRALGCRRPLLIANTYDPATHRPGGCFAGGTGGLWG